jgi:copper amine oxidase domain protein
MKKFFAGMSVMAVTATMLSGMAFADGIKTIKVEKMVNVGNTADQTIGKIEVKENAKADWDEKAKFEFKLPSNVKWNEKTMINGKYKPTINGNIMTFELSTSKDAEDSFYILPIIDVERSVAKGNITVAVTPINSNDKEESIDIAKVADFSASFSSTKKEVAANTKVGVEIQLSELIENSLLPDNMYDIVFDNATIDKDSIKITQDSGYDPLTVVKTQDSYVEFKIDEKFDTKNKWTIKMDITPKKDYTGEIKASLEGRGIKDVSTVVADVYQGVTVQQRALDELSLGTANQALGDIVISEKVAGSLAKGDYTISVDPNYKGLTFSSMNISSADGNIVVSSPSSKGNTLKFRVDQTSTRASKIIIKGVQVTLDRFAYDGTYKMNLVNDKDSKTVITSLNAFTVNAATEANPKDSSKDKTPDKAPEKTQKKVVFVIDNKAYSVDGHPLTLDVAPYIKSSRTMLPVRAVAESLDMNVGWDAKTNTVTLTSKDNKDTVILTIGNNTMLVNGKKVALDSAPEIKDSRTFLPVALVANAVGAKTDWDSVTRTVTLTK